MDAHLAQSQPELNKTLSKSKKTNEKKGKGRKEEREKEGNKGRKERKEKEREQGKARLVRWLRMYNTGCTGLAT